MTIQVYYCLGNSPQYKEALVIKDKAPTEVIRIAEGMGGIWINGNTYVPWHSILKIKFEED